MNTPNDLNNLVRPATGKWPLLGGAVALSFLFAACGGGAETSTQSADAAAAASSSSAAAQASEEAAASEQAEANRLAQEEADTEAAEKAAAEKKAAKKKKGAAEAKAKLDNAKPMTARELARLAKKPDSYLGDTMVVWGKVTQFDAATGTCIFRANIGHANMASEWDYEYNSILVSGDGEEDCPKLDDIVTDDEVKITAVSMGSYSYDTQVGGNTTVPMFKVEKIGRT